MEDPNASTGSSWIGNLTSSLGSLVSAAAPVVTALQGAKAPTKPVLPVVTPGTGITAFPSQMLMIGGAVVLGLVLLVLVVTRRGK